MIIGLQLLELTLQTSFDIVNMLAYDVYFSGDM